MRSVSLRSWAWWCLLLFLLGHGTGCATHQTIRHIKGEPYGDRIESVEHAWVGSNEVRVCIQGRLGSCTDTSRFTLHFTPLNTGTRGPSTTMETVLLPRSRLARGWPDNLAPAGFEPMTITSWAKTNGFRKVTFYGLSSATFRSPLILSEDVMLRVPFDPLAENAPRTRCRWYAFRYQVKHHLEAVPLLPVAIAADAVVACLAGFARARPNSPYYDDPFLPESEGVPSPDFNESMLSDFSSSTGDAPPKLPKLMIGDSDSKNPVHALADAPRDQRLNSCYCPVHGKIVTREK